jgi:hypothetical protein
MVRIHRFYVICGLKFVDVCWGIGGWVTIGTTFGSVGPVPLSLSVYSYRI